MSPESRNTLVTHIVPEVQPPVSPPSPGTHPEYFLAAVAADLRWRLTQRQI